jgi:hypothetical protein
LPGAAYGQIENNKKNWKYTMNIYRLFTTLPILLGLMLAPMQANINFSQASQASGSSCATSTPSPSTAVTLCFTSPQNNGSISGDTTVTVSATLTGKVSGIQRIVFYLNGAYFLTDYQSPYTFTLPSTHWVDGNYTISVEATLRSGYVTQRASIALNFANGIETTPVNKNKFQPTSGTAPAGGAPFVFAATGDGASGEANSSKVVNLISSLKPNLLIYLGDVYEKGTFSELYNYYGTQGTNFAKFRSITDPTVGNHEYTNGGSAQDYFFYWDNIPSYYSFDAGGWHFISLNSNGSYVSDASNSPQYTWLASDLSAHTQACTIVYYHEPLYNIGQERPATQMASIWALLAQHHVTIVLNGHDHDYQRWVPLDGQGKPSSTGITEFVAGGGGHGLQNISKSDSRVAFSSDANPATFGALKFTLSANSASFSYVNISGATLDQGVIPCQQSAQVAPPSQQSAQVAAPISVPTGVTAALGYANHVEVSWSASPADTGISGYNVYRDGELLAMVPGNTSIFTDTFVLPGYTYYYTVDAFDQAGNKSDASPQVAVFTPERAVSCH